MSDALNLNSSSNPPHRGRLSDDTERCRKALIDSVLSSFNESDEDIRPENAYENDPTFRIVARACYVLPFIKGIIYPFLKVSYIALAEKLIMEVLQMFLDDDLYARLEEQIFNRSPVTSFFLMSNLDFIEAFSVSACLVLVMAIVNPLKNALCELYLSHTETKRLQTSLYDRFLLTPNTVDTQEARDVVYTRIPAVAKYWAYSKYSIVDDLTTIVTCLILILILAWDFGLFVLGLFIVVVFVTKLVWHCMSTPWSERIDEKTRLSNSRLMDLVTCRDVVLTHTMELKEREKLGVLLRSDGQEIRRLGTAKFCSHALEYAAFTMQMPLLFLYVYLVDITMERVFQLLLVVVVLDEGARAYLMYGSHAERIEANARAQEDIARVLGEDKEVVFPRTFSGCTSRKLTNKLQDNAPVEGGIDQLMEEGPNENNSKLQNISMGSEENSFKFQQVSLGYERPDGSRFTVVENLDLSFRIGGHYALLGESGAGKSTLFKALSGLHPCVKGQFVVAGKSIPTTSQKWRHQVGVVSQESLLFNRSIRSNLCYGQPEDEIDDSDLLHVLDQLNMKDHILDLPQGLDTQIRENGNELSGGQRQRIQIARLLLTAKHCPVIMLDEMTSALDSNTTLAVMDLMKEFLVGKTLIMITHDLQTLSLSNAVLQMKRGGEIALATNSKRISEDSRRLSHAMRASKLMKFVDAGALDTSLQGIDESEGIEEDNDQ